MITLIIETLKGVHCITGYKHDTAFLLEVIKTLKLKGLSKAEVIEAIKDLYF